MIAVSDPNTKNEGFGDPCSERSVRFATSSHIDAGLAVPTAGSGLLAEIMRLIGIGFFYYVLYFTHLVCVWSLFAYSPYSKLGHLVYRTVAMIHAKASGRYLMQRPPVASVASAAPASGEEAASA